MITRGAVTLYHVTVDEESRSESFSRSCFDECSIYQKVSIEKRHSRNGPWRERETVIRIPTADALSIAVGDRVVPGNCARDVPPEDSLLVCGFSDNRRGCRRNWHYRILCR